MSLRDKLLALVAGPAEEKLSPAIASTPVVVREEGVERKRDEEKTPASSGNGAPACPKCGILLVEVSSGILRCQACGFQSKTPPRRVAVPPVIVKPGSAAPSRCPQCGGSPMQAVGGGGHRCSACGHQVIERQATGLSRAALENYDGPPAHLQMNSRAFHVALGWMRGFGGR